MLNKFTYDFTGQISWRIFKKIYNLDSNPEDELFQLRVTLENVGEATMDALVCTRILPATDTSVLESISHTISL